MRHLWIGIIATLSLYACTTAAPAPGATPANISTTPAVDSPFPTENLLLQDGTQWRTAVDGFGSHVVAPDPLIQDNVIDVTFTIHQKDHPDNWPYVELICQPDLPNLNGLNGIQLTYRSDTTVTIKLSQTDFGWDGNRTYAHYQMTIPAADVFSTVTLPIEDFAQPTWTPPESRSISLQLNRVDAIYIVPDLDYETGETGRLIVSALKLI